MFIIDRINNICRFIQPGYNIKIGELIGYGFLMNHMSDNIIGDKFAVRVFFTIKIDTIPVHPRKELPVSIKIRNQYFFETKIAFN
ncbi:hypothetical protein KLSP111695_29265 [Klebsiella spallanzanii]